MAVVINEFEVLDTPQRSAADEPAEASASAQLVLGREDLQRLLAEVAEQQLRLWSH